MEAALVLPAAGAARAAGGDRCRRGRATRSTTSCLPGWSGRVEAVAGGRPGDAAPPGHARPDGPAADAGRGRRVSHGPSPDAYEKAVDRLLASPRYGERMAVDWLDAAPLRRHQRLPDRRRAVHVAVARLGDRRLQPQHAVRPLHRRAARRRPAAQRRRSTSDRHRVQPQSPSATPRAASSTRSTASSTSPTASTPRPRSGSA